MSYLADLTAPDGATMRAGTSFTKTWRVRNSGTSTWTNFVMEHFGDHPMSGPESVALPVLKPGEAVGYDLAAGRGAWLHVATGAVTVNGQTLYAGDAAAVEGEPRVEVVGREDGEQAQHRHDG